MGKILFLLFIFIPLTELWLLIQVGQSIGAFNTIAIVILTAALGAALARREGFAVLQRLNQEFAQGKMPADALFDGLMILIGAILLLTPGLLTDACGFFLLIPVCRNLVKRWIKYKVEQSMRQGKTIHITTFHSS